MIHIKLFESYSNEIDKLKSIGDDISKKVKCDRHGSCLLFSELFTMSILQDYPELVDYFLIVEGWVFAGSGKREHTWIELTNGDLIDPTLKQFLKFSENPFYMDTIKKFTPSEYLEVIEKSPETSKSIKKYLINESISDINSNNLYHTSNPINRKSILKNGLKPQVGLSYSLHHDEDPNLKPLVFLSTQPYDTTYDDDIYEVNVDGLKLLPDPDETMTDVRCVDTIISPDRLSLIYKGSGKDKL
jgi:hypothetical protein